MNVLRIDTRDNKNIVIRLETDKGEFEQTSEGFNDQKAQNALPVIEKLLEKADLEVKDIQEIKIENTGGSFTGLRVGVAIANALSFSLDVKVNGKNLGEIIVPNYD